MEIQSDLSFGAKLRIQTPNKYRKFKIYELPLFSDDARTFIKVPQKHINAIKPQLKQLKQGFEAFSSEVGGEANLDLFLDSVTGNVRGAILEYDVRENHYHPIEKFLRGLFNPFQKPTEFIKITNKDELNSTEKIRGHLEELVRPYIPRYLNRN